MIKAHRTALRALVAVLFASPAWAGETAGMIKVANGPVSIQRNGERLGGAVGTAVQVGDRVRTGQGASVGITLRDNTLLSAGPDSVLVIDRFAFDNTTQQGGMSIGIRKGTLSVASGRLAKHSPGSVDFRTPSSVLGVRGTEFVVEVEGSDDE